MQGGGQCIGLPLLPTSFRHALQSPLMAPAILPMPVSAGIDMALSILAMVGMMLALAAERLNPAVRKTVRNMTNRCFGDKVACTPQG